VIELIEFLDERNRSPFAEWRDALDPAVRVRIEISLARLQGGNRSALKGVGSGVLEMRLDFGPGYRIYLAKEGEQYIILLGGGTKRRQQDDIEDAKARWLKYQRGKQAK
jgi:putative addiction module killer protein